MTDKAQLNCMKFFATLLTRMDVEHKRKNAESMIVEINLTTGIVNLLTIHYKPEQHETSHHRTSSF